MLSAVALVPQIIGDVAHAIGQGLAILADRAADAVRSHPCRDRPSALALDRHVVDMEHAVGDLDAVAGQADHPLDVIGLVVGRQLEDDDVAARRHTGENPPLERDRAEFVRLAAETDGEIEGISAVAIAQLVDEQIIADQQGRDHRSRGNVEWLEEEGADDEGDEQGLENDLDQIPDALFRLVGRLDLCRHVSNHRICCPAAPGAVKFRLAALGLPRQRSATRLG